MPTKHSLSNMVLVVSLHVHQLCPMKRENWVKCPLRREEKINTIPGVEKLGISEEVFTTIALLQKCVYHNSCVSEEVFTIITVPVKKC